MPKMNVFLDSNIIDRIIGPGNKQDDATWKEDIKYIKYLISGPVDSADIRLFVNPSVKQQILKTPDFNHREALLNEFEKYYFTEFNLTIFPFQFPATFISKWQETELNRLCKQHPNLEKDKKIIGDAAFNQDVRIDILLTADRDLARQVGRIGKLEIVLPKQLWERL